MSKLMASGLIAVILSWSSTTFAQDAPAAPPAQGEQAQPPLPAPAAPPPAASVNPAVPEPSAAPPSPVAKPPFRRSVIGRIGPVAPHTGFPLPIFVDDVRTLADLVSEDKDLAPLADHLAARRNFLRYFVPTSAIVSAGLVLMGSLMRADAGSWSKTSAGLAIGGGSLFVLSAVVVGSVYPTRSETYDVINTWNHSHPDRPIFP